MKLTIGHALQFQGIARLVRGSRSYRPRRRQVSWTHCKSRPYMQVDKLQVASAWQRPKTEWNNKVLCQQDCAAPAPGRATAQRICTVLTRLLFSKLYILVHQAFDFGNLYIILNTSIWTYIYVLYISKNAAVATGVPVLQMYQYHPLVF